MGGATEGDLQHRKSLYHRVLNIQTGIISAETFHLSAPQIRKLLALRYLSVCSAAHRAELREKPPHRPKSKKSLPPARSAEYVNKSKNGRLWATCIKKPYTLEDAR